MRRTLFVVLMAAAGVAHAEGGCPPGQYPYETPQARQCVPIPGGSSSGSDGPVWADRWGAIAVDDANGIIGVSFGEVSKRHAKRVALQRCEELGTQNCKVSSTFYNQCFAFAEGGSYRTRATAATKDEAESRALAKCSAHGSPSCTVELSDCSLPERVR